MLLNFSKAACTKCRDNFPEAAPCDLVHLHHGKSNALLVAPDDLVGKPCAFAQSSGEMIAFSLFGDYTPEALKGKSYDVREVMQKVNYLMAHTSVPGVSRDLSKCACTMEASGNRVVYTGKYVSSDQKLPQLVFIACHKDSDAWGEYVAAMDGDPPFGKMLPPTDWSLTTSDSLDVSTKLLPLSLSLIKIYFQKVRTPTVQTLTGAGVSYGLSPKWLAWLLGCNLGKAAWPSAGTRVFRGPMGPKDLTFQDMAGRCLILTIGAAVFAWGYNASLMFFNIGRLSHLGGPVGMMASASAVGVLKGWQAASIASASISATVVDLKPWVEPKR